MSFSRRPSFILEFQDAKSAPSLILDSGLWILDSGSWIQDPASWILNSGSRILDPGCIQHPGSTIMDTGSWIPDPGLWILDSGSGILDLGFRILTIFDGKHSPPSWLDMPKRSHIVITRMSYNTFTRGLFAAQACDLITLQPTIVRYRSTSVQDE